MEHDGESLGKITQWHGVIFQKNVYVSYTHCDNL
jgi:hypothetical protein